MDGSAPGNYPTGYGPQGPPPGSQPAEQKKVSSLPPGPDMRDVISHMNSVTRRLRVLEERYTNLGSKNQLTDQNMLSHSKKTYTEIKDINLEITAIKSELARLKDTIRLIVADLRDCARREDIEVLEKYLKLWEPVRFVTQSQVERIVRDVLESAGKDEDRPPAAKPQPKS